MTSLAVTLSVDPRGPCALYIISDSRITWDSSEYRWDAGRKTFASARTADVFGYCGEAFFPTAMLGQVLDQVNSGLLLPEGVGAAERHAIVIEAFKAGMALRKWVKLKAFAIFHGARDGEFTKSQFHLWESKYSMKDGWLDKKMDLNASRSYLAHLDGSGKKVIEIRREVWVNTNAAGTSRAAIWAFCDSLRSGKDKYSGGAPQLVGIWRKGPA